MRLTKDSFAALWLKHRTFYKGFEFSASFEPDDGQMSIQYPELPSEQAKEFENDEELRKELMPKKLDSKQTTPQLGSISSVD